MIPISRWEDLTDDQEVTEALKEVYGDDVEKLDLLVGLHAEKKIKGFAISETAFFIFLLIASRYVCGINPTCSTPPLENIKLLSVKCSHFYLYVQSAMYLGG